MNSEFMEKAWNKLARRIPSCLRRFPDLTNDFCREGEVKLRVPFYAQTDPYSCGAIAGWMVVETFHPTASFAGFYKICRPDPLNGTPTHRLIRALRVFGIGVSIRRDLDFDAIANAIEFGFPVIAGAGNEQFDDGDHWVVVYGVARKRRRVFVCNNVRHGHSRIEMSWRDWKAWWNPVGEGLVCWGK
ncbi:MAG: hypothetical protein QOD99_2553 [Chthoniobacter sp.]|jgi:hypothetical protein|nr:hypothetical protein [Chthoniobacter sp.]